MRLKKIKQILDEVIPDLEIKIGQVTINAIKYTRIENLKPLRKSILKLIGNNIFFDQAQNLLNSEIMQFAEDGINLEPHVAKKLIEEIEALKKAAFELKKILGYLVGPTKENSIFLKLSEIKDLNDLSESANNFHKAFSQIIFDEEIGGQIKIEDVENGSIWVEIFVGSVKAVSIIGAIAYSAALAYREIQKGRYISETRRTKKIQNDQLEALVNAQKLLLDHLIDAEAQNINAEFFSSDNPERVERIKLSISLLSNEINKGAEIKPALNTAEEVAKFFTDFKNLLGLVSRIKEIPDKINKGENN